MIHFKYPDVGAVKYSDMPQMFSPKSDSEEILLVISYLQTAKHYLPLPYIALHIFDLAMSPTDVFIHCTDDVRLFYVPGICIVVYIGLQMALCEAVTMKVFHVAHFRLCFCVGCDFTVVVCATARR